MDKIVVERTGESVDFEFLDFKVLTAYEKVQEERKKTFKAFKNMAAEDVKLWHYKLVADSIRDSADIIFGKGTAERLFGDVNNLRELFQFYNDLEKAAEKQAESFSNFVTDSI